jgi:hypothetical protein
MPAHVKSRRIVPTLSRPTTTPDLHSQLEELLDTVWNAEANWRLDDRIDLSLGKRRPRSS